MLGPAELREIYDCLKGMGLEPVRVADGRSPYLNPAFAAGMAMTKAVRGKAATLPAKTTPEPTETK
ncbi:hypothetical protein [Paramagnetospirillum magneticum]|uniref:Uncharacterized protein n=1 Tax=Paramagnetospirillum magneticum (strain ATCC 700264 / AMB-1) TaxID=342108 RepID=Q2W0B2_PARM1|nr:hypothetical protein [Paramagnetospirillum magneticum]BAE52713.1 hypothetical protein amb3909 [Paramagnetospirillum magneticum AMB-1]